MVQSVNVALYAGTAIAPKGFIRAVENIWIDSYTIAFTNTNTTIDIAVLPVNRVITDVQVVIDTSISQTSGTVSIGFSTDAAVSTLMAATNITHNLTRTAIALPVPGLIQIPTATSSTVSFSVLSGFLKSTTGTQTTISVKLNNWTMTTGTMKSIVRYL